MTTAVMDNPINSSSEIGWLLEMLGGKHEWLLEQDGATQGGLRQVWGPAQAQSAPTGNCSSHSSPVDNALVISTLHFRCLERNKNVISFQQIDHNILQYSFCYTFFKVIVKNKSTISSALQGLFKSNVIRCTP